MAGRAAVRIDLQEYERAELAARLRRRKIGRADAMRAEIVLLAAAGESNSAIARTLGVSRPTVILWRARFAAGGSQALTETQAGRGRQPTSPAPTSQAIVRAPTGVADLRRAGAARAGASRLNAAAALRENWAGLSLIRLVRELAARSPEDLADLAEQLRTIAVTLFDSRRIACAVTAEGRHFPQAQAALGPFLSELPKAANDAPANRLPFAAATGRFGWATSVPVSYVTRIFATVPYTHPDAAPLTVLAKLLRASYLHREIREKGGAYGGMASYDAEGGLFSLLSYRDPHLARTLRVYDDAIDWAVAGRFDDEAINEAILAVFSELDRPLSPGGRGHREFANRRQGLSAEMRQSLREKVLETDRAALVAGAER